MLDEMTTITRLMMTMLTMMVVMSMSLISLLLFLQDPFVELNDMQVTHAGLLRPNAPKLNTTLDATNCSSTSRFALRPAAKLYASESVELGNDWKQSSIYSGLMYSGHPHLWSLPL